MMLWSYVGVGLCLLMELFGFEYLMKVNSFDIDLEFFFVCGFD